LHETDTPFSSPDLSLKYESFNQELDSCLESTTFCSTAASISILTLKLPVLVKHQAAQAS
jgi:hypothetical protein